MSLNTRTIDLLTESTSVSALGWFIYRVGGKDYKVRVTNILGTSGLPTWNADTSWKADGSCTGTCDKRDIVAWNDLLWRSLIVNNKGHIPQEDAFWTEVSEDEAPVTSTPDVLIKTIPKPSHGFAVKDVIIINSSGVHVKLSDPSNQFRIGLVTEVIDSNTFKMAIHGYVTGLSGFVPGTIYYGQVDGTIGTVVTDMPVLHADTATSGYLIQSGFGSGGTPPIEGFNYDLNFDL